MSPLLIVHAAAGSLGLLSGAGAASVRKGERLHRAFGTLFFASIVIMCATGAYIAALAPQRGVAIGSLVTLYLVASAWATVKRPEGSVGRFGAPALLLFVLGCAAGELALGVAALGSPGGRLDGFPAAPYFVFAAFSGLAAAFDGRVIVRGGVTGAPRIARHLWRMCLALFITVGSFIAQGLRHVLPGSAHSPWLLLPALLPLLLMIFWLIRVLFTDWFKPTRASAASAWR